MTDTESRSADGRGTAGTGTAGAADAPVERLTPDELRELFLFESLPDDRLAWLAGNSRVEAWTAGADVFTEGEPGTCFFVLLDGTITLSRRIRGEEVLINRTDQRGVYGGATQAYLLDRVEQVYLGSMRAATDTRMLVIEADAFGRALQQWFPMAMHLLEGLFFGMRASQVLVSERERLVALGALSAGLTHELNNPAAAAVRATATLRERVAGMRHKLGMLADGRLAPERMHRLVGLQEAAVERVAKAPNLSALETSDAEDEVSDWLDDHGVTSGWDLAPVLVGGGLDATWLEEELGALEQEELEPAVRWLTYSVDTEGLMSEIEDAVARISTLVGAAKQYSQMDRSPHQTVDLHELLDSTLVMLGRKVGKVHVVKDYDRSLPVIPAYAAELNQVWTNVIDNALGAMGGDGTLTIRTSREGERAAVEIGDTGPGIPEDVRGRIFEPFFTTKAVGEGTGLGLDISWRIVVNKHQGDIRVDSRPGDTRFTVLLPLRDPVTVDGSIGRPT